MAFNSAVSNVSYSDSKAEKRSVFMGEVEALKASKEYAHLNQNEPNSTKRAAKNIRAVLKRAFPFVKFSVRMDGYTAINLSWTDGPTRKTVEETVRPFRCGFYDVHEDYHGIESTPFGEVFGEVEFLFCDRDFSDVAVAAGVEAVKEKYAGNLSELEEHQQPSVENYNNGSSRHVLVPHINEDLASLIYAEFKDWDGLKKIVPASSKETNQAEVSSNLTIEEHTHTKRGFQMFIVVNPDRVARDVFMSQLETAKELGGWYSKKWGNTPAGFAFKERGAAESFLVLVTGTDNEDPTPPTKPTKKVETKADTKTADKLRNLADKMQKDIDHKLADRLTNTPKRQREAGSARLEGERLKRTQEALIKLAALHDAGNVPDVLQGIKSKKAVYELVGEKMDHSNCGYYDTPVSTGLPSKDTPEALAIWDLLAGKSDEEKRAEKIQRLEEKLLFSKIPGFFPTPESLIDRMLDHADIQTHHKCLEPEAGAGGIADKIKQIAYVDCCEIFSSLREILKAKGHNLIADDFMRADLEAMYDRIVMNPPFENLQDIDHLLEAYKCLASGGRVVSIMSPAPFFRSGKKAEAFREWFENVDGKKYDLPEGSFKKSGTNVATVLVIIDKESED